ASPGLDFLNTNGVVSLADGESVKSFYVQIIDDSFVEPNETFFVELSNPSGGATLGVSNAVMTIIGDDSFGVFEFTNTTFVVQEGDTNFVTEVVRLGGTNGTVTVDFATVPNSGTALTNVDYQPTGTVLTFAGGETSKLVSVPIINDSLVELTNESFSIHLINPTFGAVLGFTTNALIEIADNDVEFVFSATNFTVFEDGGNGFVTILRQGVTNLQTEISIDLVTSNGLVAQDVITNIVQGAINTNSFTNFSQGFPIVTTTLTTNFVTNLVAGVTNEIPAISPQHFVAATNRVVFAPGVLFTNVAIPIFDNNLVESNRNIHLSLHNPLPSNFVSIGALSNAFLSISDNDSAFGLRPFSTGGLNYTANEIDTGQSLLIFEVGRSGNNTGAVTVVVQPTIGTADSTDFVVESVTVTFTNRQTVQLVTNLINGDRLPEGNEQYTLALINNSPTNSTSLTSATNATVTIIDNDTEFGFTVRQAVTNEDAGSYTFDIFRRGVLGPNDMVGFRTRDGTILQSTLPSAHATLDYNATNGVIVFGPNETLKSISVTLLPDQLIEPVEYFGVLLENPVGFAGNTFIGDSSNVLFQLLDNSGAVDFVRSGYVFGEENTNGAVLEVRRADGSSGAVSVQIATAGNGADAGFDFGQPTTNLMAAPFAPTVITNITLSWADGETGIKSFVLPIIDDTQTNEPNESVTFSLVAPIGVAIGPGNVSSVFIIDNDSPSSLDFTFQTGVGFNAPVFTVAQQANGQLVVGGMFTRYVTNATSGTGISRPYIARLDSDGGLDLSFNVGVGFDGPVRSLDLMADGRMVIGGSFNSVGSSLRRRVVRLLPDGQVDLSFVPGTGTLGSVVSIAVQADNRVLVGGAFTSFSSEQKSGIVRLTTSGSIDLSFSRGSGVSGVVNVVKVYDGEAGGAHDGKILLGGIFATYDGAPANNLVRLNSGGAIDTTFNIGSGPNSAVNEIEIEGNGRILIGGIFTSFNGTARSRIARLEANGVLDASFAPVLDDTVLAIAVESDGRIVVGGGFSSLGGQGLPGLPGQGGSGPVTNVNGILRFDSAGLLDPTFPTGGGANDLVYDVLIQSDRRIVIVGAFTELNHEQVARIARYNGNSSRSPATVLATPGMASDGRFMIQLSGEAGRAYRIESSDDLNSWQTVGEVASGLGSIVFDDPNSAARLRKFYRAVRLNQ
ncbi:MAG: putative delta-60 repeat protein, partial [Limisphaerales bacterium]